MMNGGEGGIRTHGGLPLNGFQDRRFRPLSHLSDPGLLHQDVASPNPEEEEYRKWRFRPTWTLLAVSDRFGMLRNFRFGSGS